MWNIDNRTPYKAASAFTQDKTGGLVWMVAVKATFDYSLEHKELTVAEEQEEVNTIDEFGDTPFNSSPIKVCDFAPVKPKIDVLLDAEAFSPKEAYVIELEVGCMVGPMKKKLRVVGNRVYGRTLGIIYTSNTVPFNRKPIIYENAYGGWQQDEPDKPVLYDLRNPAGTGFFKKRKYAEDVSLPNIEYPGFPTRKNPKKNRVAGFGPIAPHWSSRITYAGTVDPDSEQASWPPPDVNPLFYQCAPEDQQLERVIGGEPVLLVHLHPDHQEIRFSLPSISIDFESTVNGKMFKQPGNLNTICLTPSKPRLTMVWQANFNGGTDKFTMKKVVVRQSNSTQRLL